MTFTSTDFERLVVIYIGVGSPGRKTMPRAARGVFPRYMQSRGVLADEFLAHGSIGGAKVGGKRTASDSSFRPISRM